MVNLVKVLCGYSCRRISLTMFAKHYRILTSGGTEGAHITRGIYAAVLKKLKGELVKCGGGNTSELMP